MFITSSAVLFISSFNSRRVQDYFQYFVLSTHIVRSFVIAGRGPAYSGLQR